MDADGIERLLDRIRLLTHPCDLDLLLFFARHPRALVTSEQLAAWLGYELPQMAHSLDVLLEGKLLTRTQNRAHAARSSVERRRVVRHAALGRTLAPPREGRRAQRAG